MGRRREREPEASQRPGDREENIYWLAVCIFWSCSCSSSTSTILISTCPILLSRLLAHGVAMNSIGLKECTLFTKSSCDSRETTESGHHRRTWTSSSSYYPYTTWLCAGLILGRISDLFLACFQSAVGHGVVALSELSACFRSAWLHGVVACVSSRSMVGRACSLAP